MTTIGTTPRPAFDLARERMRLGDLDGASKMAETEIQRIGSSGLAADFWQYHFIRAKILGSREGAERALKYFESLFPPDVADVASCAELKMHCGYYRGYLGEYEHAHRLLGEAEDMARGASLSELLGETYLSRAFIFFRQKDYVSSQRIYRSALDVAGSVGGWYLLGYARWGIGKILMIRECYREAIPSLEESLTIFEAVGASLSIAMVWSELAVCHLGLGDDILAMELLQKSESVNCEAGVLHNYQVVLANIGNVYLHRGDHFAAISYYQRALALAREIKDPVSIKKWTRNINLAYARIRLTVDQQNPRTA
jgi:tetratricopeptide (TPR) repeat protein